MKTPFIALLLLLTAGLLLSYPTTAQPCSTANPPDNLASTYTPGSGVLLTWDAVPGSVGNQIFALLSTGGTAVKRLVGFELDQFFIPESALSPGTYTWSIQAACSLVPPFQTTGIRTGGTFTVGIPPGCPPTVSDADGNVYPTVAIGSQCWMAENLKTTRYRNGNVIPGDLGSFDWSTTNLGAWALYPGTSEYGLLYNWAAVTSFKGLCPVGWHVPTNTEFNTLETALGGDDVAGGQMKTVGTLGLGTGLWQDPNAGASNSSGFSGQPGGVRSDGGSYSLVNQSGVFWTSSVAPPNRAVNRKLTYNQNRISSSDTQKGSGLSVRCLKDL